MWITDTFRIGKGWIALFVAVVLAVLLILRSAYERSHLVTDTRELATDRLGASFDGYTIAILADLHGSIFGKEQRDLILAVKECKPDVILLAGDMVNVRHSDQKVEGREALASLLAGIKGGCPVIYSDGNHELRMKEPEREEFHHWLSGQGVTVLSNDSVSFHRNDGTIRFTGVDIPKENYLKKGKILPLPDHYLEETAGPVPEGVFEVLLAHNPLYAKDYAAWGADLGVTGHFHGGTIRLPHFGGVMTPQFQFFYPYTRGLYPLEEQPDGRKPYLAVSAGLGTHSVNVRLHNRAELLVLCLATNPSEEEKKNGTGI